MNHELRKNNYKLNKKYLKKSWISPKVEVRNSALHGLGLFAKESIKKDEVVVIWGGNFVNRTEADLARQKGLAVQQIDENLFDVFDWDNKNQDPSYNHNHSCDPNTWMKDEVTIISRRNIKTGEELSIDYAMFELDNDHIMPWKCQCGSELCRRTVTGKDWRKKDLQERYKNHFFPYINKKIRELDN
jgi:SET domain-containing protein